MLKIKKSLFTNKCFTIIILITLDIYLGGFYYIEKLVVTNKDIVIYKKESDDTNVELLINGETIWVNQKTMAEIFE